MRSIKLTQKEGVKNVEIGKGQEKDYIVINAGMIEQTYAHPTILEQEVVYKTFYTCWEFSREEILSMLKNGGRIWYSRMAFNAPFQPMSLILENPFNDKSDDLSAVNPLPVQLIKLVESFLALRKNTPLAHDCDAADKVWLTLGQQMVQAVPLKDSNTKQLSSQFMDMAQTCLRLAEIYSIL